MILLQITHSQKTAVVLLNAEGETLYEKDYETYELEAAWNQYDPYQMMVTEFNENWLTAGVSGKFSNGKGWKLGYRLQSRKFGGEWDHRHVLVTGISILNFN